MTEDVSFRHAVRWLAMTVWLVYALFSVGNLSPDPFARFEVAERLVRHGTIALSESHELTVEHDGAHYSIFFPGQTITFLPPAALGVWIGDACGAEEELIAHAARFVACTFVMTAFAALAVAGHVVLVRDLGVGRRLSLLSGVLVAFGTPFLLWGCNASEEVTLAALAVWAVWAILQARRAAESAEPRPAENRDGPAHRFVDRLGLAGVLLALGMIHRSTFIAVVAGTAVIALPLLWRHRDLLSLARGRFAAWTLTGLAIVALVPLYNWLRFDDPLDTGYAAFYEPVGGVFDNPLLLGLAGHLFSPGKSVFLYAPWLILLPLALLHRRVRQRLGLLTWGLLVIFVVHLVIYSMHTYWAGAFGWAVRFHVSLIPLAAVPIAVGLQELRPNRAAWISIGALGVISIAIQVAGMALNNGLEHFQYPANYTGPRGLIPGDAAWTWRASQLRLRFVNIADKLRGRPLLDVEADDKEYILTVWNLFPIRAAAALKDRSITLGAWALWIVLLALALLSVHRLQRAWRALPAIRAP
jgi:4-amino-4-deoxy-L-arabinose transferase-like glycosyltransferase